MDIIALKEPPNVNLERLASQKHTAKIYYLLLALTVMGPLMLPGYIFSLDMVFGPQLHLPEISEHSWPFYAVLHLLNWIIPATVLQKLLLVFTFWLAGIGMHRLAILLRKNKPGSVLPLFLSGTLYVINPFTYARFMDGHFELLLGYAILPIFVHTLLVFSFGGQQNFKSALKLAGLTVLTGIVSLHALVWLAVLTIITVGFFIWKVRRSLSELKLALKYGLLGLGLALLGSSMWLLPLWHGNSPTPAIFQQFDDRHLLTFRTEGSSDVGVLANVIGMQGYWGEREQHFILVNKTAPWWPLIVSALSVMAVFGVAAYKKEAQVGIIAITALVAVVLATGIAFTPFESLNRWLVTSVPFFQGYREPQKFVGLFTLCLAALAGLGLHRLIGRLKDGLARQLLTFGSMSAPLVLTPIMLWGGMGQLRATDYPASWHKTQTHIAQSSGSSLFLPWHEYLYLDFTGRVTINPATRFFTGDVIVSENAEIGLIDEPMSSRTAEVDQILTKQGPDLASKLAGLGIENIILSKATEWERYSFLDHQPDLRLIIDESDIRLYKNVAYQSGEVR